MDKNRYKKLRKTAYLCIINFNDMTLKSILTVCAASLMLLACQSNTDKNMNKLTLTREWDKTFPQSEKVNHSKVTFHNRYGIELAADMYVPKNVEGKLAAIAVSGPFGAVKEQSSGLYAQHMAERGFLTIAFDPSYTGESGGEPRRMASPDINTEDFLAAVDFLSTCDLVDPERIGIIGICGFGGMAINAAALDPRIKATVTSTMYDMSKATSPARIRPNSVRKSAGPWLPSVRRTMPQVPMNVPAVSSTPFLRMPPGLSRTITLTIRLLGAITSAAATPPTAGTSSAARVS